MGFKEFNENNVKYPGGVYISVDLTPDSIARINQYINAYLPDLEKNSSLHCTLIYSAVPSNDEPKMEEYKASGKFHQFNLFGPNNDTLVAEIKCPKLTQRNQKLVREHGYKSDYGTYRSHVTFGYHYKGE